MRELKILNNVGFDQLNIVDLETAKYLKKLGFNKPTYYFWRDINLPFLEKGLGRVKWGKRRMNHNRFDEFIYSAPTEEEATKWINKHNKNVIRNS